jgi:hypothetical protein
MGWFAGQPAEGNRVLELETLVRTAVFKSASALVGVLLQQAADRIDAQYQPKPGEQKRGRQTLQVQGIFGSFAIQRHYYYHPGRKQGHCPADAALGLEVGYTPALARLICLEGADESGFQKAERHLTETGGIAVSARQIQRVVQRVGKDAQAWQGREAKPGTCAAPVLYASADGTGVPMRRQELQGRKGKQPDGPAKTRQVYLGCVFTQHQTDEEGHPVRDHDSTTYVSSLQAIGEFGPLLRQEAIRRGMGSAGQVVLLIDGAAGLEHMGRDCFKDSVQIVDYYHALEHAGKVLEALIGKNHPEFQKQRHRWAKRLLKDQVASLIEETRQTCAGTSQAEAVEKELATSSGTSSACNMAPSASKASSSAQAWSRPVARPSSAQDANSRACSGPNPERRISWHAAAFTAADGWLTSGNTALTNTPNVMTPSACPLN